MMNTFLIKPATRTLSVDEYYFSTKLAEIRRMNKNGENVINLGIGNPDLAPSKSAINELLKAAVEPLNHGYQSYNGILELREAFSVWYKKYYDVELDPSSEILPLMGSKEGVFHISLAFLNRGDKVLIPDPGYPVYKSVASLCEAEAVVYDLKEENNWYPDFNSLEKMDLSQVKLMWVNYPNMPTSTPATKLLFEQLIAFGKRNKILIVNDNPYSMISTEKPLSILALEGAKEIAIELNSLSKSHNMAGWRVGMIGAAPHFIQTILKVKSNMDSGMFRPIQMAAIEALRGSEDWYTAQKNVYKERRGIAERILSTLGCTFKKSSSGMFLWAKIPDEARSSLEFTEKLLQSKKIFISPGFIFGRNGERYIRLSLANNETILTEVLNRLKDKK